MTFPALNPGSWSIPDAAFLIKSGIRKRVRDEEEVRGGANRYEHNSEHTFCRWARNPYISHQLRRLPSCLLSSGSAVRVPPGSLSVSPGNLHLWQHIEDPEIIVILLTTIQECILKPGRVLADPLGVAAGGVDGARHFPDLGRPTGPESRSLIGLHNPATGRVSRALDLTFHAELSLTHSRGGSRL